MLNSQAQLMAAFEASVLHRLRGHAHNPLVSAAAGCSHLQV